MGLTLSEIAVACGNRLFFLNLGFFFFLVILIIIVMIMIVFVMFMYWVIYLFLLSMLMLIIMIVVSLLSSFLVVDELNPVGHLLISVTKNMTQ